MPGRSVDSAARPPLSRQAGPPTEPGETRGVGYYNRGVNYYYCGVDYYNSGIDYGDRGVDDFNRVVDYSFVLFPCTSAAVQSRSWAAPPP